MTSHALPTPTALPSRIHTESELLLSLTTPTPLLLETIRTLASPLVIVGAGGKMGPTLAVLARRAAEAAGHPLEIIAASRFTDPQSVAYLESNGVRTQRVDLLDPRSLASLPDSANVLYLVGLKFGTQSNPSTTWAVNTLAPARLCERFPQSRIVALSTGNVYPLTPVDRAGSVETDPLTPLGEYANAAVGRDRIFDYFSRQLGCSVAILRLFYATELRYGVLVDLAQKIVAGDPVPLDCGHLTFIWMGDANEMILRSFPLASSPASAWNLCAPQVYSVRELASRLGELLGRPPTFTGTEARTALLGDSSRLCQKLGPPPTSLETMLRWTADWVKTGGRTLGKPTHFEVRDGQY